MAGLDRTISSGRVHYLSSVGGLGFSRWGNFQINTRISSYVAVGSISRLSIYVCSVSDPYHFDADPDPRIRIRDDGFHGFA